MADKITERPSYGFGDFVKALVKGTRNPEIQAALSESGGGATGDYTVPVILLPQLIDLMRAKTVAIQAGAQTILLDTETTNLPESRLILLRRGAMRRRRLRRLHRHLNKCNSSPKSLGVFVKVSMELLEDSQNVNEALLMAFAGAFAVELDRVALFGSGVAPQPHGIAGTTNVGNVSMGTNGRAAHEL